MVEPQEDNVVSEVSKIYQKCMAEISDATKNVGPYMIDAAKRKVDGIKSLKSEIEVEMGKVLEGVASVIALILGNLYTQENLRGLLTAQVEDYLKCLNVDFPALEKLLDTDEKEWVENLAQKTKEATEKKNEIDQYIKEQNQKLQEKLQNSFSMAFEPRSKQPAIVAPPAVKKTGCFLRKLPMWGL